MQRAAEYAAKLGSAFNIITSAGAAATQSVWHLHLHVVPRSTDDGLMVPWGRSTANAHRTRTAAAASSSLNTSWPARHPVTALRQLAIDAYWVSRWTIKSALRRWLP